MKHQQHVVKKAAILVCISLIFATLCAGCVDNNPAYNNLDTRQFYANIKQDANADYGKKTAFYGGRVYYLSAESGIQGIYSMNADGTDVRLEQATEDIRALTVNDDGLYYAGFSGYRENCNGKFRGFQLYFQPAGSDTVTDILGGTSQSGELTEYSVWDFYIDNDGTIAVRLSGAHSIQGYLYLSLVTIRNGSVVPCSQYTLSGKLSTHTDSQNTYPLNLYQFHNLYISVASYHSLDVDSFLLVGSRSVCLCDTASGKLVLGMDRLFSDIRPLRDDYSERWICGVEGSRVLLNSDIVLTDFDLQIQAVHDIAAFTRYERIYSQLGRENDLLLLTENLRASIPVVGWADLVAEKQIVLGEHLYRVDTKTGELTRLLLARRWQEFVYLDQSRAAIASSKTILLYDISGDKPKLIRRIHLSHRIVDAVNKVDTAGGWLFLYGFNEQTERDELLDKVFIG